MTRIRRLLATFTVAAALAVVLPVDSLPGTADTGVSASRDGAADGTTVTHTATTATPARRAPRQSWTGTWEAAPSHPIAAQPNTSIRNVVHTSIGGTSARIRFTNRFGTAPLQIGSATVALQIAGNAAGAAAVPGSVRPVTHQGATAFSIPAGQDLVSDAIPFAVPAGGNLLVTLFTPVDSGPATYHRSALQTNFFARGGDHTANESGTPYTATTGSWYHLTGVDVLGSGAAGSVVALGDSITDGTGSTRSANKRWPDRLAARLRALPAERRLGVLNAGIAGNRIFLEGTGPSALSRFEADVLSRTGVRTLIVMQGVNDIKGTPNQTDPAAFETAYRDLVQRAHAQGIRVIGGTITPYGGNSGHTPAREAVRQAVNTLVRTGGIFDAVIDFDAAVRDPAQPDRILPAYDQGDHLHFNDAGMTALGDAVDLDQLTAAPVARRVAAVR